MERHAYKPRTAPHFREGARRNRFFSLIGVRLEITDDAIGALVASSMARGTGSRALRLVVDQILR